jgi:hypothetical protein
MSQSSNYELLLSKLDHFIRKYYINNLLKGTLYFIGVVVGAFILINVLENNFYFDKDVRKMLFYTFLGLTSIVAFKWLLDPLLRYFHLGKTISHEQAATIIGDHFTDVKDKLLNVLQLKKMADEQDQAALIIASINQKTEKIKLVPFQSAIDLGNNKKYLKYAAPPLLCLVAILLMSPSLIKDSTYRLINNDRDFEKDAPFKFIIENKNLSALQFEDFVLKVNIEGDLLPEEVFINIDGYNYKLNKVEADQFEYTFRNVQKSTDFLINAAQVKGLMNTLEVMEKPNIANFVVGLRYPTYLDRNNEELDNIGDLIVPEGTVIDWSFTTKSTEKVNILFGERGTAKEAEQRAENLYNFKAKAVNTIPYKIFLSNKYIANADSLLYNINVIKDQYPAIVVDQLIDSLDKSAILFVGNVSDDYGISSLVFNYTISDESGKSKPQNKVKVGVPNANEAGFQHVFRLDDIGLNHGDNISYYFEVYDNDGVNGAKATKSQVLTFKKPSIQELKEMEDQNEEEILKNLQESLNKYDKMEDKYKKLKEKLLNKKDLDWQDRKELEKLLDDQKKLQEQMKQSNEKMLENMKMQNEMQNMEQKTQDKQDKLEQMMKETISEEDQELMERIQELMQELDKDDALRIMDEMQMQNENMEKKTERLKELFKQLKMEKDIKEQVEKLNDLAEKQEDLAEKTEKQEQNKDNKELQKEQQDIKKELEDIQKELKKLEEENKELAPPKDMGEDNQEKMDDAKKDMDKADKEMKKDDNKSASKAQKSAAQKMKKQSEEMSESMEGGDQEQQAEDIKTIRQILENLITLSVTQEDLFGQFAKTPSSTPKFRELVRDQLKIKDDFKVVEDSLIALSNRNDQISSYVNEKVTEIKYNMSNSVSLLEERQVPQSTERQRRSMTNLNDLALMLSESMENMQKQQAGGMPGAQMCQNPGNKPGKTGNVPMDKIGEGQEGMGGKLKELQDKMKQGGKEGGANAKDFAEAAAKQAELRKALQDMRKEKQEQGKGGNQFDDIIDMMDKMETDLVNKRLNAETLKRQKDITTRLLEAEKAERQRGEDEKRKSETALDIKQPLPPALQEYLKKRNAEVESYKTVSPALKPYYRFLVDEYYKSLKAK